MEDNQILNLYFRRSEQAIKETDTKYGNYCFRIAYQILASREDAEESVSDTYLKAWDTIPPHKPQYFFAYIARICRNFALDKLDWKNAAKRKAEIVSLTQEMEACVPDAVRDRTLEGKELGMILDSFLRTLSAENRMIFMRRYWFADTVAEIAVRYGISESAVRMRLNRTRDKLAGYLKQEGVHL